MMTSFYPPPHGDIDPHHAPVQSAPMTGGRRRADQHRMRVPLPGRPNRAASPPRPPIIPNPPMAGNPNITQQQMRLQQQIHLRQQQQALQQAQQYAQQQAQQQAQHQAQQHAVTMQRQAQQQQQQLAITMQQAAAMRNAQSPSRSDRSTSFRRSLRSSAPIFQLHPSQPPPSTTSHQEQQHGQGSQETQPLSHSEPVPSERVEMLPLKGKPRTVKRCVEPTISKDHSNKGQKRLKSRYIALQLREKKKVLIK